MKSNVCKIEKGTRALEAILHESEKVAEYNGLTHKQALQLRLLCEEIDGMLPNLIGDFEGKLWIEYEAGECKITVSIKMPDVTPDEKEALIGIATNKKNAAAVGIVGKIRCAIENFFLCGEGFVAFETAAGGYYLSSEYVEQMDYSYLWSLDSYRGSVKKDEHTEAWDELEKSVIASVADDVIVGVKGKRADIIVIKKFA